MPAFQRKPDYVAFRRNAFVDIGVLSELFTTTICQNNPLVGRATSPDRVEVQFQNGRQAPLGNGCSLRFYMVFQPDPDDNRKPTTTEYSYAVVLGDNYDAGWIIRYEYVPKAAETGDYRYSVGHMHVNATVAPNDAYAALRPDDPFSHIHIPTRRISVEQLIEFLIVEFNVPVKDNKKDEAIAMLRASHRRFLESETKRY